MHTYFNNFITYRVTYFIIYTLISFPFLLFLFLLSDILIYREKSTCRLYLQPRPTLCTLYRTLLILAQQPSFTIYTNITYSKESECIKSSNKQQRQNPTNKQHNFKINTITIKNITLHLITWVTEECHFEGQPTVFFHQHSSLSDNLLTSQHCNTT